MNRHKKRIGVLTLTIFLLMTFISGFGTVLADDKTPVSKGPIAKPAINSAGGGNAADEELDKEFKSNVYNNRPHLDDLKVRWGSGSSWDIDLINSSSYNECFATEHSITVPDDEIDVEFNPHKADWSEWWAGTSMPSSQSGRHRNNNDDVRSINDFDLVEGKNIITIRVGDTKWQRGQWHDVDVLTVTLTVICTVCTQDKPHLDSLIVDGVELIDEPSKKTAGSHTITVDDNEVDVMFDPHKADWSEWWYGTNRPSFEWQRHRSENDKRFISDVDLDTGENIITICVGDREKRYGQWRDVDVLTITLTIIKRNNYKLTLDQNELTLRVGKKASLNARVEDINSVGTYLSECNNELPMVKWGFVVEGENESDDYVVPSTNLITLKSSGDINEKALLEAEKRGQITVIAYLEDDYANGNSIKLQAPEVLYVSDIPYDWRDTCVVTIKPRLRSTQPEPADKPDTQLPQESSTPPALEALDVTITIGNQVALVNGEQVTLDAYPILIGEDRAMVNYADMSKLIPGLEVVWDWQTLSVTFSKDGKELKMVLDEIPAGFDVPFMNIGGRLVVPVRYVGTFFGATVDWIGDTLVVHMYK